jgi:MFS family permease
MTTTPSMAPSANTNSSAPPANGVRKAVLTALIGQILEWYDFFLYGTAAALVFGTVFFPAGEDPLMATIAAFGTFAVGFVARPFGGVLWGHIGDRRGRKFTMTLTLALMGASTCAMGLLPSYAQAGVWSPALLVVLRMVQSLAAAGEWSGSILVISENAPRHRRGLLTAWSPSGAVIGFVLSSGSLMLMKSIAGDGFITWGWRVPFLASAVLICVGLYLRTHMHESQEYEQSVRSHQTTRTPLKDVLRTHPWHVGMVFGLRLGEGTASWIFFAFSIAYGKFIGLPSSFVLGALTCSMVTMIPFALLAGHLADKIGRRPVYLVGSLAVVLFAYPFFLMLNTGNLMVVTAAFIIANGVILGLLEGVQPSYMSELLPAPLRYSGIGIGREISSVLGAGIAPMVATALFAHYHSAVPIAIYLGSMGAVTLVTTWFTPETYPREQREQDQVGRGPVEAGGGAAAAPAPGAVAS